MARRGDAQFPQFPQVYDPRTMNEFARVLDTRLRRIEQAIKAGYSVTGTFTERRTLNGQTGTATEVREALATLLQDMLGAGSLER